MTTTDTATKPVILGRRTIEIITVMLKKPRARYYCAQLSELTGLPGGTVQPNLVRLQEGGYLFSEWEDPAGLTRRPRRYFWFTPGSAKELRDILAG
jgi:PadR family transcriptional regulator PadR